MSITKRTERSRKTDVFQLTVSKKIPLDKRKLEMKELGAKED